MRSRCASFGMTLAPTWNTLRAYQPRSAAAIDSALNQRARFGCTNATNPARKARDALAYASGWCNIAHLFIRPQHANLEKVFALSCTEPSGHNLVIVLPEGREADAGIMVAPAVVVLGQLF